MNTKFYLFILLIVIGFSSCYTPKYLPKVTCWSNAIPVMYEQTHNLHDDCTVWEQNYSYLSRGLRLPEDGRF
jgi:hypothetical protein